MSEIILQITQSQTIETEVDAFRQYLYARQLFLQEFKKAIRLGMIDLQSEDRFIEDALWNIYKGGE